MSAFRSLVGRPNDSQESTNYDNASAAAADAAAGGGGGCMTSQEQHRVPGRRPRALNTPQPIDQRCCGIVQLGPLSCRSSVNRDAAWSGSGFIVLSSC